MMIARLYTGCQDIVSLRNAYHGNAAGTMGATAQSNWKFNVVQVLVLFVLKFFNLVALLPKHLWLRLEQYVNFRA